MGKDLYIKCTACGTVNRIHSDKLKSGPICGRCKETLPPPWTSPVHISDKTFDEEVIQSPLPVLVDFWAAWCAPCRSVAPVLDELARELAGKLKICKIDTDSNKATALKFKIDVIPSLLFFRGGLLLEQMKGAMSKDAILFRINRYLDI